MTSNPSLLEMFPCLKGAETMCGGLSGAIVKDTRVNRSKMEMSLSVRFTRKPSDKELALIRSEITSGFGLRSVKITAEHPESEGVERKAVKKTAGALLYGKPIRGKPVPISGLTQESGDVVICGEVFEVHSREVKNNARVLSFDITDQNGSIRVSKYIRANGGVEITEKIGRGMYLTVKGSVTYNRYDEDISLEPASIAQCERPLREDRSADKRVELHLHTRMSAMDALTDPAAAVETAARWGHPAIAVTDHGVAQAFPELWKAKRNLQKQGVDIKVIYGIEGYLENDVDDKLVVVGGGDYSLRGEFVAFDLETTGLDPLNDMITEIGAVIVKDGVITASFETFVNPGIPIPHRVTELTGITDRDVYDAPEPAQAIEEFLYFAGNRPLIAHNAEFDVGFISTACRRTGIEFDLTYVDTLTLSQALMPERKRHGLDQVAEAAGLEPFRHHRAEDDAIAVARIFGFFLEKLGELGAETLSDLARLVPKLFAENGVHSRTRHIILLAKNKCGLKNLYRLISDSHLETFRKHPIIRKSKLMDYRDGIIVGAACESGEVFNGIVRNRSPEALRRISSFYDYLEIQPLCNNAFLVHDGKAKDTEALKDLNRRVIDLGRELGIPVLATGDVHFLEPEHEIYRRILLAGKQFSDADSELPIYFKTTDEMLEEFSYLGEETAREVVITNPNAVAAACEDIQLFPKELYTPEIENSADDLTALVRGRLRELYGDNPPAEVTSRVDAELSDIISCKYDVIYMSAQKLVKNSVDAGYLVGSRGSVGSSVAAYLAGITEVNALPAHYRCASCFYTDFTAGKNYGCGADMPDANCPVCGEKLKKEGFDIPFETFLGIGGDKVPDIDLNFSGEYQARAHKYTEELFGKKNVYRAGTINTIASKTAYGYVKNYLNERGLTVTKAEENRLTNGLVGVKRSTGQHPGGLVIIPQNMDVTDFCPVQHPADSPDKGVITTHFDYHSMEDNLLKLDELGHDDPTMIKMLEDMTGIDATSILLDDAQTLRIFKSPEPLGIKPGDPVVGNTGTIGIPEFGTGFTRAMLTDTQPESFDTLVRLSGFSHGTDVWLGNAKDLILNKTADISQTIGCRDDIMLYLISQGMDGKLAFKIMESVRKGRGVTQEWEKEMKKHGVPGWYIESCQKIKYLFPKAHAAAYVMMAFRISWFKVHMPLAYYSAYFYRRSDSFDAEIMTGGITEVRRKLQELYKLEKPTAKEQDLITTLESVYEFYLRGFDFERISLYESDAVKFLICGGINETRDGYNISGKPGGSLRPPFTAISGLGEAAAKDIVAARRNRRFISAEELTMSCSKVSQTHIEQLRQLGALGDLPDSSQISLF